MPTFFGQYFAVTRREYYWHIGMATPNFPAKLESVHSGHDHVGEHHVETRLFKQCKRLACVRLKCRVVSEIRQNLGRKASDLDVVLDDEDPAAAALLGQ